MAFYKIFKYRPEYWYDLSISRIKGQMILDNKNPDNNRKLVKKFGIIMALTSSLIGTETW